MATNAGGALTEQRQEEEEAEGGGRKMDPEIRLIGQILRDLQEIDDAGRARVVSYLSSRFKATV